MPNSRATHSPAASVRKLRRTPLRKDWPNRARASRAFRARSVPAPASEASTGGKGSRLLPVPTGLLDRGEVLVEVRLVRPQPAPRVVSFSSQVVPQARIRLEPLHRFDELL